MPDEIPSPPGLPRRTCPACGEENIAAAVRCFACGALLDAPPLPELAKVRAHFDEGLESEPRYGKAIAWRPKWTGRDESPLNHVLRAAGVLGLLAMARLAFGWEGQSFWGALAIVTLVVYLPLRGRAVVRARDRAAMPPEGASVAGCLDAIVRGVGCVSIGIISIGVLFFVICMAMIRWG